MTMQLCVDGVFIDDNTTLKVCVDGVLAQVCTDGTIVYDLAAVAAPDITTSATLDALNDNDGDITNGAAITAWTPTNTGGAVNATGGYTVVSGALPTGLTLDADTGVISGTPTVDGAFSWTIRATGAGGTSDFADSVTVASAGVAPDITTSVAFPDATVGVAYTWTPTNTGGAATSYTLQSGALPAGLSLNPVTGEISGTPTAAGVFAITVRASNAFGTSDFAGSITSTAVVVSFTGPTGTQRYIHEDGPAPSGGIVWLRFLPDGTFDSQADQTMDPTNSFVIGSPGGTWATPTGAGVGDLFEIMTTFGPLIGSAIRASDAGDGVWFDMVTGCTISLQTSAPAGGTVNSRFDIQIRDKATLTVQAAFTVNLRFVDTP